MGRLTTPGTRTTGVRIGLLLLTGMMLPTSAAAQTETVEYYALDAIGSVRVVFDANGAVVSRLDFGPFGGQLFPATGAPKNKFAGLFRDEESGLDYAQARMYESRTGRFTRPDPVYAGLFEPQQWNRYAYALNNPLGFVDTNGLQASSGFCTWTSTATEAGYSTVLSCLSAEMQAFAGGYGWTPGGIGTQGRQSGMGRETTIGPMEWPVPTIGPAPVPPGPTIGPAPEPSVGDTQINQIAGPISRTAGPLTRPRVYGEIFVVSAAGAAGSHLCAAYCSQAVNVTASASRDAVIRFEIWVPGLIDYARDAAMTQAPGPVSPNSWASLAGAWHNIFKCYLGMGC